MAGSIIPKTLGLGAGAVGRAILRAILNSKPVLRILLNHDAVIPLYGAPTWGCAPHHVGWRLRLGTLIGEIAIWSQRHRRRAHTSPRLALKQD